VFARTGDSSNTGKAKICSERAYQRFRLSVKGWIQ